ncbi:16S rRNA (cytosine(967)-C(5))-methyltransferase [Prochlorococcus marinus]|nr:16S rRNA (cytosine(967)-C(5))-methyltransferase [Prochlorococcus marinus]
MAAWKVLQAVSAGAYAETALDQVLNKYSMKAIDKALTTEIAYGSIRQRKYLDSWIDNLAKISALKQPPRLRWLLHIGLYQIFLMERIPVSAVVNTTVQLAKNNNLNKLSSVVNGILRNAIRIREAGQGLPFKSNASEELAQSFSIPLWLANSLITWRGEQGAKSIAMAFNQPPAFDLRINRCKTNPRSVQEIFDKFGITSLPIKGCTSGLQITSGMGDLRKWPGYEGGEWSVQDRSSQWIAPLLEAEPGDRILDACSAPGGKATHLAELIDDNGEIWAVDRSPKRLQKVSENATRLGLNSLKCLAADASMLLDCKPHWKGYFQRILVDAPCSGLGTLSRNPDARWRMTPEKIDELIILQARLLRGVLPLLSPGGRIVYSTCTMHPEENFKQVGEFLALHPKVKLKYQNQIWPDDAQSGDGFYAAVIDID